MEQEQHLIRELRQLILIQKKLDYLLNGEPKNEQIPTIIEQLDSTQNSTTKIIDAISSNKIKITEDLLTTINHELRTPLVPIRTYAEMLLQGKFGTLNPEQAKRVETINLSSQQLQKKIESLLGKSIPVGDANYSESDHKIRELEQEKILLVKINKLLDKKINDESAEIKDLKKDLSESEHQTKEFEQENLILDKTVRIEEQKNILLAKKNIIVIATAALVVGAGFTAYSLYVVDLVGQQYHVSNLGNMQSGYVIQNLRGDTIDTFLSWRLVSGALLHVGITNGEKYPEKIRLIKEVVLSDESVDIDDSLLHKGPKGSVSTYYMGWAGALTQASKKKTQLYIPSNLQVVESSKGEGDINIVLSSLKSGDGYTGYTTSIADDSQNQILKSTITIYDVENLSDDQFTTILRHELGHAFGLAHSTAPEDLMHPVIQTGYPYISDCDIDTIVSLYDGGKNSQVICEK
ncbi:MAG: matrixin family metalloprotease [Thaumarchaeota archaeon]|nr:matrixin family metalloprotease [Nitrososphaerota archaeon]